VKVAHRDGLHRLRGRVAQYPFGAAVENLDDARRICGDPGEVCTVEDRALQGARPAQRLFCLFALGYLTFQLFGPLPGRFVHMAVFIDAADLSGQCRDEGLVRPSPA
jgi:hypothetical protein